MINKQNKIKNNTNKFIIDFNSFFGDITKKKNWTQKILFIINN